MKFSIKDFFSKCDQIRRKLRIWSHLLKKSLMENFIFCAVNYFLYGVFDQDWHEFQLKYWHLCFSFRKIEVPDSLPRDLWCYQNWHVAIENSESKKFFNSASYLFSSWRLRRHFKMVKRNISFYERKKDILTNIWTLHERKSSYYEFFVQIKSWYYWFLGVKRYFFQPRRLVKRSFLSIYKTLRTEKDDLSVFKKTIRWCFL